MDDIARRVGVHRATVSNVLNGKYKAERSDAARRAAYIRRVAEEMGFRPSLAARATRTGRTGLIGMIRSVSKACAVIEPEFDSGLDEALHARGYSLLRDLIPDDATEAPRIVRQNAIDGLIINHAFGTPAPIRELLDRCGLPTVWVNRKRDADCVRPNDYGAAQVATRFLLDHGHDRVAFLDPGIHTSGPDIEEPESVVRDPHYSRGDRIDGYAATMADAGLKPDIVSLQRPTTLAESKAGWLLKTFVAFLRPLDRPTAVLCNADGRTMLHAASIVGLRVPQDLSVICFDTEASADERTAVDRVLVPYRPMGMAAVAMLCDAISQPGSTQSPIVIPFEFHRTGTVARPGHGPVNPLGVSSQSLA
ncbi:MAG: LacI family DNA-binding transcriptional regulator [Planctomycetota bacterium]